MWSGFLPLPPHGTGFPKLDRLHDALVDTRPFFLKRARAIIGLSLKGGVVSCLEAKSGRKIWRKRLGGNYWASPLYADGKIYFFNKEGQVSVISAAREFQLLAENNFDGSFIASPAVAGKKMILRSLTHLYCIEKL